MNEVAYYDKTESNLEKSPKSYSDFTYDNESNGGVLQKFSDIGDKIKSVKTDISNLNVHYKDIIKKYEAFSNFETSMNSIINTMTTRIDNINTCYTNILNTAQQAVKDHVSTDKTLIDDLDTISALISGKTGLEAGLKNNGNNAPLSNEAVSDLEFKNTHGGHSQEEWNRMSDTQKQEVLKEQAAMQGGKITDQNETAVEDKYSMSSDLDKVADEIIQGKYGNGEDRYAELEKQGYNLRDKYDENGNLVERGVQDIVNEKMNGTYDPSKNPTNTSGNNEAGYRSTSGSGDQNLTDKGYPSSTEGYESQKAAAQAATAAAQERGKAQTEYYQKQQAQAAANAAQERGKAQTEYYKQQQQKQAEAAKQQAQANSYSTGYQSPQRMNEAGWGASGTTNYKAPTNNSTANNSTPSYSASNYATGNSSGSTSSSYAANPGGSASTSSSTSTAGANSIPSQQELVQSNLNVSNTNNTTPQFGNTNYNAVVGNNTNNNNSTYNPSMDFNPYNYGGNNNSVNTSNYSNTTTSTTSSTTTETTSSSGSGIYELPSDPVE